ncbi:hypothetical protein GCM10009547_25130 [Sporichthya brevicatena]|uniref:TolB protein n=1 Tax=Sporichthya brevicatena TaxID=171442 RepID=A0ABN1GW25_9ACTN
MRTRVLLAATAVLLALTPGAARADDVPPPPKPLPAQTEAKPRSTAPWIAYSALPYSEAAGPARGYLGAGDVRLVRSDGVDDRAVTTGPATEFEPTFSPDGVWIAFSSDRADVRAGRTDIWVVRRDGTGLRRLTTNLNARRPAWSPDGTRIAAGTDSGIVTFTATGKKAADFVPVTKNDAGHVDFAPTWTPDGARLLFTRTTFANGAATGQSIWSAPAAGGKARPLLGSSGPSGYLSQPDVSPDGKFVTFLQADASGTGIWLVDISGSPIGRLAHSATGLLNTPTFSPDGGWILFTHSGRDGNSPSSIRLVNVDGTKTRVVTRITRGNYYAPTWDPSATTKP